VPYPVETAHRRPSFPSPPASVAASYAQDVAGSTQSSAVFGRRLPWPCHAPRRWRDLAAGSGRGAWWRCLAARRQLVRRPSPPSSAFLRRLLATNLRLLASKLRVSTDAAGKLLDGRTPAICSTEDSIASLFLVQGPFCKIIGPICVTYLTGMSEERYGYQTISLPNMA
jgi:hypothetical protein